MTVPRQSSGSLTRALVPDSRVPASRVPDSRVPASLASWTGPWQTEFIPAFLQYTGIQFGVANIDPMNVIRQ